MEKKEKNFAERVEEIDALLVTLYEDFPESTSVLCVIEDTDEDSLEALIIKGDMKGLSLCMAKILTTQDTSRAMAIALMAKKMAELGN